MATEDPCNAQEEASDPELDAEVDALLDSWGVKQPGQKRKRQRFTFEPRRVYPGFQFTESIRHQHVAILVSCMRHYDSIRDDAALAEVLATLLQAEHPDNLAIFWQYRNKPAHARLCEVLLTAFNLLKRHPEAAGEETLKRLLRRARPFQLTDEGKAAVGLTLGRLMLDQDHIADAYDSLTALAVPERYVGAFEREMMLATVRRQQWIELMQTAAAGPQAASQQQQNMTKYNPFDHSNDVWARAGRNARDLCQDLSNHLESALKLMPEQTDAALGLMEVLLAQGKRKEALKLAVQQCNAAPFDVDANAMNLALLLQYKSRKSKKRSDEAMGDLKIQLLEQCCSLLRCSSGPSDAIAKVLLSLGNTFSQQTAPPPLQLIEGLCLYLDTTPPRLDENAGLILNTRSMLANLLCTVSAAVVEASKLSENVRRKLRAAQHNEDELAVDQAALEIQNARVVLEKHMGRYSSVQSILQQREWWLKCHLDLPKNKNKLQRWLSEGIASAAALASASLVHAALLYALEAQKCTLVRLGVIPPNPLSNWDAVDAVTAVLIEQGHVQLANEVKANVSAIREAPGAVVSVEERTIESSALLAARCATSQVAGGQPYPLGAPHSGLGFIAQLPTSWWLSFPQIRRELALEIKAGQGDAPPRRAAAACFEGTNNQAQHPQNQLPPSQPATQRRVRFLLPGSQVESVLPYE